MKLPHEIEADKQAARLVGAWVVQVGGARGCPLGHGGAGIIHKPQGEGVPQNLLLNTEAIGRPVDTQGPAVDQGRNDLGDQRYGGADVERFPKTF